MSAGKVLWGQVLVVALVVLVSVWSATEWTAWRLAFQPELGQPFGRLFGTPLYAPPVFFWWWFEFDAYAPKVFARGAYIAAGGSLTSVVVAMAMSVRRARESHRATTYGSAHWAVRRAVAAAGLLGQDGAVLGRWKRRYLRHDGPEHVLCFAPTRSGKGVGLVIPSLLIWGGSAIVHDIKGENYELTAGLRAGFSRTLARSCSFRPRTRSSWSRARRQSARARFATSRTRS